MTIPTTDFGSCFYLGLKDLQHSGAEWNILSQGSRELEGLLKLVSKERLQLERHFVLATQVRFQ